MGLTVAGRNLDLPACGRGFIPVHTGFPWVRSHRELVSLIPWNQFACDRFSRNTTEKAFLLFSLC